MGLDGWLVWVSTSGRAFPCRVCWTFEGRNQAVLCGFLPLWTHRFITMAVQGRKKSQKGKGPLNRGTGRWGRRPGPGGCAARRAARSDDRPHPTKAPIPPHSPPAVPLVPAGTSGFPRPPTGRTGCQAPGSGRTGTSMSSGSSGDPDSSGIALTSSHCTSM